MSAKPSMICNVRSIKGVATFLSQNKETTTVNSRARGVKSANAVGIVGALTDNPCCKNKSDSTGLSPAKNSVQTSIFVSAVKGATMPKGRALSNGLRDQQKWQNVANAMIPMIT